MRAGAGGARGENGVGEGAAGSAREVADGRRTAPGYAALALLPLVGAVIWGSTRPGPELLQGQVEVRTVNVSAKIPGRIDSILVREGESVAAGALVAVLGSPELDAKAEQAEAAVAAAEAQESKAREGARRQEVEAARAQAGRAEAAEALAATTYARIQRLYDEGVVPEQKRDEAATQLEAARLASRAARAQLDMAIEGARAEDRAAAAALVRQARGGRAEVAAYAAETRVVAPMAGEVAERAAEPGEVVGAGLPIVTLADLTDAWIVLSVREDRLARFAMGDTVVARIPALADREVVTRVRYIAPQADYATWRATGATGDFDLRTFELHLRPLAPVPELRPGMSALIRADRPELAPR